MSRRISDLKVISSKRINSDFSVIELTSELKMPSMKPGQFAQVRVDGSPATFLRRPISIHDFDPVKNTLKMLVQVVGPGTRKLSELRIGDAINVIFPLGNSFTIPEKPEKILLVGGGCGIAPLLFLAKALKTGGNKPDILLGFRSKDRIIEYDNYLETGTVYLATEDGSVGEKGVVTAHTIMSDSEYSRVYCCGPNAMMKAISTWAENKNITCEVSLENLMACGIGVCLCCVVNTKSGHKCTCVDGPVFNSKDLKW